MLGIGRQGAVQGCDEQFGAVIRLVVPEDRVDDNQQVVHGGRPVEAGVVEDAAALANAG